MWDSMPEDVRSELLDPGFDTRTHGKKSTYAQRCRGPLCRKAERDAAKEDYRDEQALSGKSVKQVKLRTDPALEALLARIMEWHHLERLAIGKGNSTLSHYRQTGAVLDKAS